jgi:ubiquinol-cytochrome c reductase cytochrome b subunit
LHQYGSTNPLGVNSAAYKIGFSSYYGLKDAIGIVALLAVACILVCFYPDLLGHPDNLIPANPYATPAHIVPEWYFLWVYAILRSIPNKAMGVAAIGLMFACLAALPFWAPACSRKPMNIPVKEAPFCPTKAGWAPAP